MTKATPLEPCPFCGGPGTMTTGRSAAIDARPFYNPSCEVCDYVFQVGFFHVEDAIKAWNTRPAHDTLLAENQRLRQAMGWILDAADAACNEDSSNVRIHEMFNIAAQSCGIKRRLPDEYQRFTE